MDATILTFIRTPLTARTAKGGTSVQEKGDIEEQQNGASTHASANYFKMAALLAPLSAPNKGSISQSKKPVWSCGHM